MLNRALDVLCIRIASTIFSAWSRLVRKRQRIVNRLARLFRADLSWMRRDGIEVGTMCGILRKRLEKERYLIAWSTVCLRVGDTLLPRPRIFQAESAHGSAAEDVTAAVRFAVSESIAVQPGQEQVQQKMLSTAHLPGGEHYGQGDVSGGGLAPTCSPTAGGFAKDDVAPIGIGKALQMRKVAAKTYGAKPLVVALPESIASSWEQFQARSQSFQRAMTLCD